MKKQTTRVRKVPIKHLSTPHTNFQDEIYQSQKTDKFFDRINIILLTIMTLLAITYIIIK